MFPPPTVLNLIPQPALSAIAGGFLQWPAMTVLGTGIVLLTLLGMGWEVFHDVIGLGPHRGTRVPLGPPNAHQQAA